MEIKIHKITKSAFCAVNTLFLLLNLTLGTVKLNIKSIHRKQQEQKRAKI